MNGSTGAIFSQKKMGIIEKIKEIEAEMARTQKNKATGAFHICYDF